MTTAVASVKPFTVRGIDTDSGQPTSMNVPAESVADAAAFAARRGVKVAAVVAEGDRTYIATADGAFARESEMPKARADGKPDADKPLLWISFCIPIVGFIAGAVRLTNKDSSGVRIIRWTVAGAIAWGLLVALFMRR